ncbi:MAG: T9SS type A sorting domain-containing protein, partial [Bacteroidales bacterium]
TSRNAFSMILAEQNCIYYNKELNAIMATFRGNDKPVGGFDLIGTGNDVVTAWSSDMGNTFLSRVTLQGTSSLRCRYPSGVIYNPIGNTDLGQAFSLVAGPITSGAGWTNTYLSSVQYNGNNFHGDNILLSPYLELYRNGLSTCTNGKSYICATKSTDDGIHYTYLEGAVITGTFNNNTLGYDWASQDVDVPFMTNNGYLEGNTYSNMAWSKDGSVGYMMHIGIDNRSGAVKGYYPILHKSVDQGTTWQLMDYFDFSTFYEVYQHVISPNSNPDIAVPWFWEADMVVDVANNLHIMALCKGHVSQNPDSLNYFNAYDNGSIFEFTYEQGGQWNCSFIDHPKTREVTDDNSPFAYSEGNLEWTMRLQASRTDDGSKVFAVWTDTDWQFYSLADSINLYPDVMAWSRDINSNAVTSVKNITYLEVGMGEAHFMFVSPVVMDSMGKYEIPISISDINTSGLNADEPIAHYFLQGVSFSEADYFFNPPGVEEHPASSRLMGTNYPNPYSGQTNFDIYLTKSTQVSLVVTSITGKVMGNVNYGVMGNGAQTLTFDAGNLSKGIYFYTITIGDQKATNKMIIK